MLLQIFIYAIFVEAITLCYFFHSWIKFMFIFGFIYMRAYSIIQLPVYIILVLFHFSINVLLIAELYPNYSSVHLDIVSTFGTSSFMCKNFILCLIHNIWVLVLVNLVAGEIFGTIIRAHLGNRPLLIHSLLKYIFELHFRIFLFILLYR